ncbi:MAG: alpha/beta fold hydrolase [Candidatus Dormibacteria bacterium]
MPLAEINGIRIHHEIRGQGPPLLLILGTGGDVSEFSRLIDSLAAHHRAVAFDNRSAGRSDRPDAPYSIQLMASDTFGMMEAEGLDHAAVLGISLGGRIAMELALCHPERVERLILVSTSARTVSSWRRRHLMAILATAFARGPTLQCPSRSGAPGQWVSLRPPLAGDVDRPVPLSPRRFSRGPRDPGVEGALSQDAPHLKH